MEEKKNPKADLTRKSGFFFSIALLITMSFVLFAFELKQHEVPIEDIVQRNTNDFENIEVPATDIPPPLPPKLVAPVIIEVPDDDEIEAEVKIDLHIDVSPDTHVEPMIVVADIEPEKVTDEPFVAPEVSATPKGGMNAFYKYLGENINYPAMARRTSTQGKVFVEFVINRDGSIVDAKVIKGVGMGCDEEALRVIQNSPAWTPGKQRGVPVRQRMVVPVIFQLNSN